MNVTLLAHYADPAEIIAGAARLCYSDIPVSEIMKNFKEGEVTAFIRLLAGMSHESPLEHITFTFAIEGISRACSHQLVRHRIASFSQRSQRYTHTKQGEYVIPPAIMRNKELLKKFNDALEDIDRAYNEIADTLHESYVKERNLTTQKARNLAYKEALEDARYILPNASATSLIMTMNARELLHFFEKRMCTRAQWEIRQVATEMLKLVKQVLPEVFENAGAPCDRFGTCPEGAMSCGKLEKKVEHKCSGNCANCTCKKEE